MRRFEKAALVVGMGLMTASCVPTGDRPSFQDPEHATTTTTLATDPGAPVVIGQTGGAEPTQLGAVAHDAAGYRELVQTDAPVNLILIPNSEESSTPGRDQSAEINLMLLLDNNPLYLSNLIKTIGATTFGAYQPADITVSETPAINLGGCLDHSSGVTDLLMRQEAKFYEKPGALNVIIAEEYDCDKKVAGYSSPGNVPVLSMLAMREVGLGIMHEGAHSMGENHAESRVCPAVPELENCEVPKNPSDRTSLMNYIITNDGKEFSAPELYFMGLVSPAEVLNNPGPGLYTLGGTDTIGTNDGIKLIRLTTAEGVVSISWQKDPQATFDTYCELPNSTKKIPAADSRKIKANEDGTYTTYFCYQIHARYMNHSLQTRVGIKKDGMYSQQLLLGPDRAPDDSGPDFSNGAVLPNTVVFQDATVRVTFVDQGENNQAHVLVEAMA